MCGDDRRRRIAEVVEVDETRVPSLGRNALLKMAKHLAWIRIDPYHPPSPEFRC